MSRKRLPKGDVIFEWMLAGAIVVLGVFTWGRFLFAQFQKRHPGSVVDPGSAVEWMIMGLWVVCGVLTYGLTFALLQKVYPDLAEENKWRNRALSGSMVLLGPLGLIGITIVLIGELGITRFWRYGLKF